MLVGGFFGWAIMDGALQAKHLIMLGVLLGVPFALGVGWWYLTKKSK
jgi:hypothetical protein